MREAQTRNLELPGSLATLTPRNDDADDGASDKTRHLFVSHEIVPARRVHSSADCGSLFVGQPIHAPAARFDFARHFNPPWPAPAAV